jgi:hypothetical protein
MHVVGPIVKWKGKFSTGFLTQQGIRQGAKLSPTLYKGYNNQLLDILRDNNIGAKIGTTFIGCPTVADDIALISYHPEDLQHALHIVHNETRRDKVVFGFVYPPVVTTAAFIGDVFAVNPRCIGFCTLVRVGSIWSLIILSNILPRTRVTAMPL